MLHQSQSSAFEMYWTYWFFAQYKHKYKYMCNWFLCHLDAFNIRYLMIFSHILYVWDFNQYFSAVSPFLLNTACVFFSKNAAVKISCVCSSSFINIIKWVINKLMRCNWRSYSVNSWLYCRLNDGYILMKCLLI